MNEVKPLRLLIKTLLLYAMANLAFAYFQPPVGKLSLYNWLITGRERVPYEREESYYSISHTVPVYEDFDAMYQSHILSQPKADDEFRVFLIGDSSAWGFQLRPEETLAGQITALNLTNCDGKRIVAYNAAFPLPYVMKDLLIMDKVREYEPDLFLWTITLDGFRNRSIFTDTFLDPYAPRVQQMVDEYQLANLDTTKMHQPTFWDKTIIGQRSRLKKILLLQLHGLGWQATGLDYYYNGYAPLSNDQTDDQLFFDSKPGNLGLDSMLFDVLDAGFMVAGDIPVLAVNEPIFIASGANSDIRYNEFYPRWAYDEYRTYTQNWMDERSYSYVDAWDAVPPAEFTDTPFHRSPAGEKLLAELLQQKILELSCSK